MTLPLELAKLEQTAKAATPEEWIYFKERVVPAVVTEKYTMIATCDPRANYSPGMGTCTKNAIHIATFNPQTALILLEVIREQQKALEDIENLALGGLDMSTTKFNKMVTDLALPTAREALASIRAKVSL